MTEGTSAMRRMLRPMRTAPAGTRMTEARAWRHAVPRAAEQSLGLVASVVDVEEAGCDHAALTEGWDETAVVWRLEGDGTPGLAILDAAAITALIEVQTLRRVGRTAPVPRPATPIDAALCAPMVGDWLASRDAVLADASSGWRPGKIVTTQRAARFLLEEGEYRIRRIRLSFADGAREGTLTLALPVPPVTDLAAAGAEDRSALLLPEAALTAILHRGDVPFRWLQDLAVGSVLEIPRAALETVRIESEDGRLVARAKLGQVRGHRALRLCEPPAGDTPAEMQPMALSGIG